MHRLEGSIPEFIRVGEKDIRIRIRRSGRARRLALRVGGDGKVELVLPLRESLERANEFLMAHKDWLAKSLAKIPPPSSARLFRGKELQFSQSFSEKLKLHRMRVEGDTLIIESPAGSKESMDYLFDAFIYSSARRFLPLRCMQLARQHNFSPARITVRNQRTRWGSCSRKGGISLNAQLMMLSEELMDYVIFHELCHIRHHNHSPAFWKEVEKYVPQYAALRAELKQIRFH